MLARVSHQLRRRVEAHRLGVEQAAQEGVGVVVLDPAAHVGEQREAGGVALGEAVFAEALDLLEDALGVLERVALLDHPADQTLVKRREAAAPLPCRHRAAQRVGLAGGEVGRQHGDLHHLLLEDRHAPGSHERGLEFLGAVDLALGQRAVLQVRMHHAALDRAGPHDRHFDHQVVVAARLQARQHAHLRAALDLERAHRVGLADHVVGGRATVGHVLHLEAAPELGADVFERAADRAQHADGEDVDLQQAERVEVVLVPLDHAAVFHARVFHRHQLGHAAFGDDEAAGVLREMARKADELRGEFHPQLHHRRFGVEAVLLQALGRDAAAVEPVLALRDRLDALQVDAERAARVAQRRAGPVADHHRRECSAMAAVLAVDVLDDLFAALVLEVDVDVGRLVALDADEAAEEHGRSPRVDLGHEEAIADQRVGGAAAALAQDALRARPAHDVGHGEEVGLVLQLGDDRELALDGLRVFHGESVREALRHALFDQPAQPGGRRLAHRHDLLRVLVFQLAEREAALRRDRHGVLEPLGRVERGQPPASAQVLFGIGLECVAAFGHRLADTCGAERVLQRLSGSHVHQHVACGGDAQTGELRHAQHALEQLFVSGAVQQFERDGGAIRTEPGLQPHRVGEDFLEALRRGRHQQRNALRQPGQHRRVRHLAFEVARVREVGALGGTPPRNGDPVREVAVTAPRLRQQHQPRVRLAAARLHQPDLAADDEVQALGTRLHVRAHHAGERALVGDGERTVAERRRPLHQLFGVRGARQEAEVAAAVKLGVTR